MSINIIIIDKKLHSTKYQTNKTEWWAKINYDSLNLQVLTNVSSKKSEVFIKLSIVE